MPLRTSGQRKVASVIASGAQIVGNVTQTAGQILLRDGAVGDLPIAFASDTDTGGPYRSAANEARHVAGGIAQLYYNTGAVVNNNHTTVNGILVTSSEWRGQGVFTPGVIGANQNDYAGATSATFCRWASSGIFNVTGLAGGSTGRVVIIVNVGANQINLTNEDAASTAGNRWTTDTGANVALTAGQVAIAVYDGTTSRWRVSIT